MHNQIIKTSAVKRTALGQDEGMVDQPATR